LVIVPSLAQRLPFRQGDKSAGTPSCHTSKDFTAHLVVGIPPRGDLFAGPEAASAKP
jgi:hypothetical protein